MSIPSLQKKLLTWFDAHGRKNLPWQKNKTPYRVWVSEIMLQQTQVSTVIPYFEQFMQVFPTLKDLAKAPLDQVLHLWAGLGYYSRARNLHRAANTVLEDYQGQFPNHLAALEKLPGIGRSTAGAILAFAFEQHAVILDGNVKRVLARVYGIHDPINTKATEEKLWQLAEALTPAKRTADYTQAIMDLGATLCTRRKPNCSACPLTKYCLAHQQGIADQLPRKEKSVALPRRASTFLILQQNTSVLLQKRPAKGIWGGLWCLPEITGQPSLTTIQQFCQQDLCIPVKDVNFLDSFKHTFTHFHLDIFPVLIKASKKAKIVPSDKQIWYNLDKPGAVGLPAPIQTLLRTLK